MTPPLPLPPLSRHLVTPESARHSASAPTPPRKISYHTLFTSTYTFLIHPSPPLHITKEKIRMRHITSAYLQAQDGEVMVRRHADDGVASGKEWDGKRNMGLDLNLNLSGRGLVKVRANGTKNKEGRCRGAGCSPLKLHGILHLNHLYIHFSQSSRAQASHDEKFSGCESTAQSSLKPAERCPVLIFNCEEMIIDGGGSGIEAAFRKSS